MREKNRQGEEIGPDNEENMKQQTKQQPTKQQTTYEIILTLPTAEKETRLTQTPVKTKPDKKHLQVPKPKRKTRTRDKEKTEIRKQQQRKDI